MSALMHQWADDGTSGLIEAPTGTGKSYAILAAALDWLAGSPDRTAIIATFTKQLQQQLAHDVIALDATVAGLLEVSAVVKGSANRLSLRALLATLADASELDQRHRLRRANSTDRFLRTLAFRELLTYLYLRLLDARDTPTSWQAHSVDPVDVPAFFAQYCGGRLPVWLDSLSQGQAGEYDARSPQPVAAYTDAVTEALAGHRLIMANHALLLAHTDDLAALVGESMLVIDEAHMLENAATSALSAVMDYRLVEDLHAELATWTTEQRASAERSAVSDRVADLGDLLDVEQLPKAASLAFDARSAGAMAVVGSRSATLASAYTGTPGITQVQTLSGLLRRLAGHYTALTGALGGYHNAHSPTMDFFEAERLLGLICKVAAAKASCERIVGDIDAVLGAPAPTPPAVCQVK